MRKNVQKRLLHAAKKMAEKYNASKKIKTVAYKLGEAVTVKVPVQDRGPCDLNRIPGIIVEEKMAFTKSKHNMVF